MTDSVATVVAAIITAIMALIAARFDDIVDLLRKPSRNIKGTWDSRSFEIIAGKTQGDLRSESVVKLTQRGAKVRGVLTQVKVSRDTPAVFRLSGKVLNDYFSCDSRTAEKTKFFISSGLLYIHPSGDEMSGYIIANSQPDSAQRTRIRYIELTRRK